MQSLVVRGLQFAMTEVGVVCNGLQLGVVLGDLDALLGT